MSTDRRLLDPMPDGLVLHQRHAADPAASAWVEANAGSGKTHVLTDRVVRLLLTGVQAESILCLTYTKAAAAEMRRRVSQRLSGWALMAEDELFAELEKLEERAPDGARMARARTLFAHALDTPGGLRVVTIHAFCESILHRFPLEAGVAFDFAVIDETEADRMVLAAREAVLAAGINGDPALADPVATLFDLLSNAQIDTAIDAAIAEGRKLRPLLTDVEGAKARLRAWTGHAGRSGEEVRADVLARRLIGPGEIAGLLAICPPSGKTTFEAKLAGLPIHPSVDQWLGAFLTKDLAVGKNFPKKAFWDGDPTLAALALAEAERLAELGAELQCCTLVERSEALLDVLAATWARFEAEKRARSLLDFDDLIDRVGVLFSDAGLGPWVRYKLDAGISHILLDEGQDTNPEQWRTVRAIADEFFVPGNPAPATRTLFAVGDQKQSIYSFQGADPEVFVDTGGIYAGLAAKARMEFRRVPLHTSFRTLPAILGGVDRVFARPELHAAVLATGPVHHDTARAGDGGTITLWPVEQDLRRDAEDAWPLDVPIGLKSAARLTAERIAGHIADWVAGGRVLAARGRAVTHDDILVLVQSRSAVFGELIRALHLRGVPTPGADRLTVTSHIAVLDLIALGDVLLTPSDDLQLAALLRSPLFEVTEDELYALARPRPEHGTLWEAMKTSTIPSIEAAQAALTEWRKRLDFDRPFGLFADVLYRGGGLRRFHARMGGEIDDVFAEFLRMALDHEQTPQPSLVGFLTALRAQKDITIKRELGEAGAGVRVMTVHGAKGLEAPVVILADAAGKPRQIGAVFIAQRPDGPILVHASGKGQDVPQSRDLREASNARERAEYWRRLYVGMTRAEDELYLTGSLTQKGRIEDTWYHAVREALAADCEIVPEAGEAQTLVFPAERGPVAPGAPAAARAAAVPAEGALPALPRYRLVETVRPSSAYQPVEAGRALDSAGQSIRDAETARRAGIALHALLQHLCGIDPADRLAAAGRALPELLPDSPALHAELARRATGILSDERFAQIFGPDSRAEVPFLAMAKRRGTPVRLAGRIDRVVVTPQSVLIVDFKSDALEPLSPAAVKDTYLTQIGLYALLARELFPARSISAAILWTTPESLMNLPAATLQAAVDGFTMA